MSASAKVTCTLVYTLAPCAYTETAFSRPTSCRFPPFRNESLAASQTYTHSRYCPPYVSRAHAGKRSKTEQVLLPYVREVLIN